MKEKKKARTVFQMKKLHYLIVSLVVVTIGFVFIPQSDFLLNISKSIDIFGRVYKEVTSSYVDEIDPEQFMQAGIEGMLGTLDPYTVYIKKSESDEVDLLTNGKYGGIGVTIGVRDGGLQVITVMEGHSAQRQGIFPGDRILEVNGTKVSNQKPEAVRSITRGDPGTEVKVLIQREGEAKPILFVLIREDIQVKNITFAGFAEPGIAYVRLERFSRKAGDELRQAIKELKVKGEIRGFILDLRGNPGGLLDAAVEVSGKFVPRGSLIVRTKGRRVEVEREYASNEEPLLADTPLAILTDRGSASASEIVAGAIQDLDRGIVVGTRTFGKGLVQTILPLSFGAQLKITTARYYIPSGRSIQEIDYIHKDKNGVIKTVPDSLKREFKTKNGRTVFELGGISPDTLVTPEEASRFVRELHRKSFFFKFATSYAAKKKQQLSGKVDEEVLKEFQKYLESEQFDFEEEGEIKIRELKTIAEQSRFSKEVLTDLDHLTTLLSKEKRRAFDRFSPQIRRELMMELMARKNGEIGRIEASLPEDVQVQTAISILKDPVLYKKKTMP